MGQSKVIEIYDYKNVDLSPLILPFEVDRERLENDINLIIKKNGKLQDASAVEADDMVTLCCQSSNAKFNKEKVTLKVGRGLYDIDLEQSIIGMQKGDQKVVTLGDFSVDVKVLDIKRMVLPELNDENVKGFGIKGIGSVADLEQFYINLQHQEDIEETVESVSNYVKSVAIANSVFELDDEKVKEVQNHGDQLLQVILEGSEGEDVDVEKTKEAVYNMVMESHKSMVIGRKLMAENNVVATEEDFENAILGEMEYNECSREEVLKYFTRDTFENQFPDSYYTSMIEEHVRKYIEEKEY